MQEEEKIPTHRDRDDDGPNILPWLIMLPLSATIAHGALERSWGDVFRYSTYLAIPIGSIIVFFHLMEFHGEKGHRSFLTWVGTTFALLWVAYSFGASYYSVGAGIHDLYNYLGSPASGRTPTALITIVGTFLAGLALFCFRLKYRVWYGLSEVVSGVAIAAYRVTSMSDPTHLGPELGIAVLTAGVYLVVRGLDNIHQGNQAKGKSAAAKILVGVKRQSTAQSE